MHAKRVFFFLLLFAFCFRAYPAIFVVTSNADSGPGTLRDALTQAAANGNAVKDYINFNLPDLSAAGRTINLISQLPDLSPNLVIDGTTQLGSNFGVSNSKINVNDTYTKINGPLITILRGTNIGDCLINGIGLSSDTQFHYNNYFVSIINSDNIQITNCLIKSGAIYIYQCQSFTFQSNVIGYLIDGITGFTSSVEADNTSSVVIGGTPTQGNLMSGSINLTMYLFDQDWTFLISNNKLGSDFTGKLSTVNLNSDYGRISITSGHYQPPSSGKMTGSITNNLIVNFETVGIVVTGFGDVGIKGNLINTDVTGKINFSLFSPYYYSTSYAPTGIVLQEGINAVVGGNNSGDPNTIAYLSNGILEQLANQVVITQNSIFCLNSHYFNIHDFFSYSKTLPQVQINKYTLNTVSGTATPGARVELFSNNEGQCPTCDPRHFFSFVTADNLGNWIYKGPIPSNIVASAIFNNQTSHFTVATIEIQNLRVTQSKCGDNTGSIQGLKYYNANGIKWINQNGQAIANTLDINNLSPGKYKLKIGSDVCGAESDWIEIIDNSIKINSSTINIQNPACNLNGSISGITVATYQNESFKSVWIDQNLNQVGNTLAISDLVSGNYILKVTDNVSGCSQTYGPVTLKNTTGPNIDQSKAIIQPTNCGQSTGSISNLVVTGTGTLKYSWLNGQQQQVATSADLVNQPAGTYKLQVTDDTQCSPIFSSDFEIPELNGITLDESNAQTTISSCSKNNGSVTGIKVDGATQYQWLDANHKVVATTPDLQNASAGDYTLTASNSYGCTETSKPYHIGQQLPTQFPVYTDVIVSSCLGDNNGSVSVTTDALVKSLRWQNSQGQTISTASDLTGVPTGVYQLYFTDQNGCESLYGSFTVPELNKFTVAQAGQATNDQCGLKNGSISATVITGGLPPYTYKWVNAGGVQVGSGNALTNIPKGNYTLNVVDTKCGDVDITYTINEQSEDVTAPSVNNAQLCSSGTAILTVNNPVTSSTYRLYDSQTSTQPLDEQPGGSFTVSVNSSRNYFISQLTGTCESSRAEVKVTVGISALNIINAFTPNGDGINDYWKITGIENYPDATVRVFNRYGQKEFDSKGYAVPFDGRYDGKILPPGVYYYIINLSNNCNMLSGSLTIIR